MGQDRVTFLIKDTAVGLDVGDHVPITDGGTVFECVAIAKAMMVADFTMVIRRPREELLRITIPAHTPPDTRIVVRQFSINPLILTDADVIIADIISSDGSQHNNGMVTAVLRWHPEAAVPHTAKANRIGAKRKRNSITCPSAARCMEGYIERRQMGMTEFATLVGTTDRTLREFRRTGRVRRDIFDAIAKQLGTTREALLNLTPGPPASA